MVRDIVIGALQQILTIELMWRKIDDFFMIHCAFVLESRKKFLIVFIKRFY